MQASRRCRIQPRARLRSRSLEKSVLALFLLILLPATTSYAQPTPPEVGQKAPDFTLSTPEGAEVTFNTLLKKGEVVLVVLRGYPGYQCPYCQRQVHDFIQHAGEFASAGAQVLLVYPGPPAELASHAQEFIAHEILPPNVRLVIDPDYKFTNLYGLRWDAPAETAYPSTFLVSEHGIIFFRKISHSHGDRATWSDVLAELKTAVGK